MWGESWINIAMMLADAPYYKTENKEEVSELTDEDLIKLADNLN